MPPLGPEASAQAQVLAPQLEVQFVLIRVPQTKLTRQSTVILYPPIAHSKFLCWLSQSQAAAEISFLPHQNLVKSPILSHLLLVPLVQVKLEQFAQLQLARAQLFARPGLA